mgnify:CR=1 FL=1
MKKIIQRLIMSIMIMQSIVAYSQDVHFSQIFETPLLRNPSLAGIFKGDIRFQSVYRTQWNSVTTPYQTTSLSGEFKKQIGNNYDYITIGGQIVYDKEGYDREDNAELRKNLEFVPPHVIHMYNIIAEEEGRESDDYWTRYEEGKNIAFEDEISKFFPKKEKTNEEDSV